MKTTQTWKIGDCLQLLPEIPDKSINMILTDLPYGTTACKWDTVIPFESLWKQYERIIKDNGAIVLTASQPFTSALILSNLKLYKYELIWLKTRPSNVFNANKMFMKWHENVCIFYKKLPTYNPQKAAGKPYFKKHYTQNREKGIYGKTGEKDEHVTENNGLYHPKTVLEFSNDNHNSLHPTQKPLSLFEYLIMTYTNEGDTVHDSCLGSGTTLEACMNLNRNCIGFEIDPQWEPIYKKRLSKHTVAEQKPMHNIATL